MEKEWKELAPCPPARGCAGRGRARAKALGPEEFGAEEQRGPAGWTRPRPRAAQVAEGTNLICFNKLDGCSVEPDGGPQEGGRLRAERDPAAGTGPADTGCGLSRREEPARFPAHEGGHPRSGVFSGSKTSVGEAGVRRLQRPRGETQSWQSRGGKGTGRGLWEPHAWGGCGVAQ